ncbi:MAG: hypothetical protein ACFFD2_10780 [Promethearchaeota archaeon]
MKILSEKQEKLTIKQKYWFIPIIIKISVFIILEISIISLGIWLEHLSIEMSQLPLNMTPLYYILPLIIILYYLSRYTSGNISGTCNLSNLLVRDGVILISDKKRRKFRALAILQIQNIPENIKVKEERIHKKIIEKLIISGAKQYLHTHLTYLGKFLPNLIFELYVEGNEIKLRILVTLVSKNGNELIRKIKLLKNLIETAFIASYPGLKFESLTNKQLKKIFGDFCVEFGHYNFKFKKNTIILNHKTNDTYLSILKITNLPIFQVHDDTSQIDQLIRHCLGSQFDLSFIVSSEPIEIAEFDSKSVNSENVQNQDQIINIRENLRKIRQSEVTGVWNLSGYFIVRATNKERLESDIEKIKIIFKNIYESDLIILNTHQLKKEFPRIPFRLPLQKHLSVTSEKLAILYHLPEKPVPSLDRCDIPKFNIPSEIIVSSGIQIGKILLNNQELYPVHLDLKSLKLNLYIVGEKSTGKSRLVMNILRGLSEISESEIKWICFDWKREYRCLSNIINDKIIEYSPNSVFAPASLNLFDPCNSRTKEHARKLFFMLHDIFPDTFGIENEYVMIKIFERIIKKVKSRSLGSVINEIKTYIRENPTEIELINKNIKKTIKFFLKLKETGNIFDGEDCIDFNQLIHENAVINLKPLLMEGKNDEARLFMNACLKNIIDRLLKCEVSRKLKHMIVIENADQIAQSLFCEVPENPLDDVPLKLRSVGVGFIMISPHPVILKDSTKSVIVFKTKYPYKVARHLYLNELQEKYIQRMERREAIMKLPNFPTPFRIYTNFIDCKNEISVVDMNQAEMMNTSKRSSPVINEFQKDHPQKIINNLKNIVIKKIENKLIKPVSFNQLYKLLKNGPLDKIHLSEKMQINVNEIDSYLRAYINLNIIVKSLNEGKETYHLSNELL